MEPVYFFEDGPVIGLSKSDRPVYQSDRSNGIGPERPVAGASSIYVEIHENEFQLRRTKKTSMSYMISLVSNYIWQNFVTILT